MKKETARIIKGFLIFAIIIAILVAIAYFTFAWIYVNGKSMLPTLEDGDRLLLARRFVTYEKGDVIVFRGADGRLLVKRIIATEGDVVEVKDDEDGTRRYFVNDEMLSDEYVNLGCYTKANPDVPYFKLTVPEGKFFYLGDNRLISSDSSDIEQDEDGSMTVTYGIYDQIVGKVLVRFNFNGKFVIKIVG